jgi:putative methyltransferase (TIGR04325 family)
MSVQLIRRPAVRLLTAVRRRLGRLLQRRRSVTRLVGPFPDWAAAAAAGHGYDRYAIFQKTADATRRLLRGEAVYERDSVLFDRVHYSWPLLSGLLWVAAQHAGRLNVLDFGGALGSSLYQNRAFLQALPACRWNVVEQLPFVDLGRAEFSRDGLFFYPSIAACLAETAPQVALLSSVLGYLADPEALLAELAAAPLEYLIIDRTAVWDGDEDRIYVQHVAPLIYSASYPCRIFSAAQLSARLERDWQIISRHDGSERLTTAVEHRYSGLIARRRRSPQAAA